MADDLNKLNAPYGVYACTGNHEYYADGGDKIGWLREKTNIVLLQDTVVKVADSFYVAAVGLSIPVTSTVSLFCAFAATSPIVARTIVNIIFFIILNALIFVITV